MFQQSFSRHFKMSQHQVFFNCFSMFQHVLAQFQQVLARSSFLKYGAKTLLKLAKTVLAFLPLYIPPFFTVFKLVCRGNNFEFVCTFCSLHKRLRMRELITFLCYHSVVTGLSHSPRQTQEEKRRQRLFTRFSEKAGTTALL